MMIGVLCLVAGLIIGRIFAKYIEKRIDEVCSYRSAIIEGCSLWDEINPEEESALDWCYCEMPGFWRMLFSFKKLEDRKWMKKDIMYRLYKLPFTTIHLDHTDMEQTNENIRTN